MAKTTEATRWDVIVRDETGAMVDIDYTCPYCGYDSGDLVSIGASSADKLDGPWEIDLRCEICDHDVIVQCD